MQQLWCAEALYGRNNNRKTGIGNNNKHNINYVTDEYQTNHGKVNRMVWEIPVLLTTEEQFWRLPPYNLSFPLTSSAYLQSSFGWVVATFHKYCYSCRAAYQYGHISTAVYSKNITLLALSERLTLQNNTLWNIVSNVIILCLYGLFIWTRRNVLYVWIKMHRGMMDRGLTVLTSTNSNIVAVMFIVISFLVYTKHSLLLDILFCK